MRPRYRISRTLPCGVVATLTAACGICYQAHALTETGDLARVQYTIHAPDWTWQGGRINVLVVFHNPTSRDAVLTVDLALPPGKEDHFECEGENTITAAVPRRMTVRAAFTNIFARTGVPRQVYNFSFVLRSGDVQTRVPYPVRTIRGAVVSRARWALWLPVALCLAWCGVFLVAIRRFAEPGASRRPSPPIPEPKHKEPWIDQKPA